MPSRPSALQSWTPDEIARGRQWVEAWKRAAPEIERMRREDLRALDAYTAISWLVGPADYTVEPRAPKPTSGLIEQQRLSVAGDVAHPGRRRLASRVRRSGDTVGLPSACV